jgi:hypothetical protein
MLILYPFISGAAAPGDALIKLAISAKSEFSCIQQRIAGYR